jgi:hypothetical protein
LGRKALLLLPALLLSACGGGETTTVLTEPPATQSTTSTTVPEADGGAPPPAEPVLSKDGIRALDRFAADAPGEVAIAVSPLGGGVAIEAGAALEPRAWSTMKVPLLAALIDSAGGIGKLGEAERGQAEAALTASDNEAALALFDRLGELEGGENGASAAIESVLRRAGDTATRVNTEPSPEGYSTFGQTIWQPGAANLFFEKLAGGCLLDREGTKYVLSLMEDVVADQRWGLGEAPSPPGAAVAFKGGWGPEPNGGYLVRQSGVVTDGDRGYVMSVIAIPDDTGEASFAAGQDLVSEATRVVAEDADAGPEAAVTCER